MRASAWQVSWRLNVNRVAMPNDVRSFWRDKAKLDLLSPEKRWQFYLKSIAKIIPFVGGIALVVAKASGDNLLLAGLVASIVYPCYLIAELFWKGGQAGAKLMDELDYHATVAQNAQPDIRLVKEAMYDLCSIIRDAGGVYATGLNLDQWNASAKQFVDATFVRRLRTDFGELGGYTGPDEVFRVRELAEKRAAWLREMLDKITPNDIDSQCTAADVEKWLLPR